MYKPAKIKLIRKIPCKENEGFKIVNPHFQEILLNVSTFCVYMNYIGCGEWNGVELL